MTIFCTVGFERRLKTLFFEKALIYTEAFAKYGQAPESLLKYNCLRGGTWIWVIVPGTVER